jgi:heat shock protein HslJ
VRRRRRTGAVALSSAAVAVAVGVLLSGALRTSPPEPTVVGASTAAATTATPSASGALATAPAQILGRWQATEIDGKPVEGQGKPVVLWFGDVPGEQGPTWSADDGCNQHAGPFTLSGSGFFRAQQSFETQMGCSPIATFQANLESVLAAHQVSISGSTEGAPSELALLGAGGQVLSTFEPYDWAADTTVEHAGPEGGQPSVSYLKSYVGLLAADAAERATGDGWTPQIIGPDTIHDASWRGSRLHLITGADGVVKEAGRG